MKKVYKLTAFNMQGNYFTETLYFSNKKEALKQMSLLKEYLIDKYNLSVGNIENIGQSSDVTFTTFLDNVYNVTLTEYELRAKASSYI